MLYLNTNKPHSFFLQNASCIRKSQVISGVLRGGGGGGVRTPCTLPLDSPLCHHCSRVSKRCHNRPIRGYTEIQYTRTNLCYEYLQVFLHSCPPFVPPPFFPGVQFNSLPTDRRAQLTPGTGYSYSFKFAIETTNTLIHNRSSFVNHTRFQTKMGKI